MHWHCTLWLITTNKGKFENVLWSFHNILYKHNLTSMFHCCNSGVQFNSLQWQQSASWWENSCCTFCKNINLFIWYSFKSIPVFLKNLGDSIAKPSSYAFKVNVFSSTVSLEPIPKDSTIREGWIKVRCHHNQENDQVIN